MPSREMVEQLKSFVYKSSWTAGEVSMAYHAYKELGHKYPNSMGCPDCMKAIIHFWRAYITEHGNG